MAKRNTMSGHAVDLQPHPADHILPQIEDKAARLWFREVDGRQFLMHTQRFGRRGLNLDAAIGSVKALSPDDVANHLRAIDEHRKAIDRHTVGIQAHLKSMLDFDDADDDDDDTDDPELLEGDDKASFLAELKQLAEQAQELASK